ncbi:MAG: CPXCG motif-containing cysteine-rich protein [Bacteroidetes bacterium]|nr:CPXCG motif-containing cysteine-rich protein [Bacteroidota bacterium]
MVNLIIEDKQDFSEDCYICCRPNRIVILTAKEEGVPSAEARLTDK